MADISTAKAQKAAASIASLPDTDLAAFPAPFLPESAPPPVVGTDPPSGPIDHLLADLAGLVGQQPVTELRIVNVGVEQRSARSCSVSGPVGAATGSTAVWRA